MRLSSEAEGVRVVEPWLAKTCSFDMLLLGSDGKSHLTMCDRRGVWQNLHSAVDSTVVPMVLNTDYKKLARNVEFPVPLRRPN